MCLASKLILKVEAREAVLSTRSEYHMPIAIEFVSSRRKKIAVDVVPAEWQLYIAQ
ncbi:MAG TPA: hypothetical protein PKC86_00950 [Candidatus Saccharibacteria bacterium]|nr:hypothetical protein [Candidatus Saccharibacteria bacterium]